MTVRTAQKWEAERGLPVKRLSGPKGRVWAIPEDLDHWLKDAVTRRHWWASLPFLRAASLTAGAVLLVLIGIFVGLLAGEWGKGPPARFVHDFRTLIVTDAQGRELWRKTFPDPLFAADTPERKLATKSAWFGDLDGDGRVELLYIYGPDRAASRGASLYCFSDTGQVKWLFVPGGVVQTRAGTFAPPFIAEAIAVLAAGPDRKRRVVVSSTNATGYPAQVALLASDGEYWHSGRLPGLDVADLDGDGVEEILLAGTDTGYLAATLIVLDSRNVSGAAAEAPFPDYQLLGFQQGAEKARILLSRTCINQKLERSNMVNSLSVHAGEIYLRTWERYAPVRLRMGVNYALNFNLKVTAVNYTDRMRAMHREMEGAGQLDHSLTEQEIQRLRELRVLASWAGRAGASGRK